MFFLLNTPEYTNVQSNTTKVKVHLRNGVAEVFDQHQDLIGTIDNNIVEIETNFENRLEKILFVLQDAVFVVSTKGLDATAETKGTSIYIYAKRAKEINSALSIEEMSKQYEVKNTQLENEIQKLTADGSSLSTNSKILLLQEETTFINKVLTILKERKSS